MTMSDRLSKEKLERLFRGSIPVTVFDEIDSTNEEAKRRIRNGETGPALIVSEGQSAGKGRVGHDFYSPKYTGIYMSLIYPVRKAEEYLLRITAKAAVAVVLGIQSRINVQLSIKWVNDIYSGSKKVAGILTELVNAPDGTKVVVVGIGINVNTTDFPPELQATATSLSRFGDPAGDPRDIFRPDRNDLIYAITDLLTEEIRELSDTTYLTFYRMYSNVLGRPVVYSAYRDGETEERGTALEIDEDGALVVLKPDGTIDRLTSGEIRVRT